MAMWKCAFNFKFNTKMSMAKSNNLLRKLLYPTAVQYQLNCVYDK